MGVFESTNLLDDSETSSRHNLVSSPPLSPRHAASFPFDFPENEIKHRAAPRLSPLNESFPKEAYDLGTLSKLGKFGRGHMQPVCKSCSLAPASVIRDSRLILVL